MEWLQLVAEDERASDKDMTQGPCSLAAVSKFVQDSPAVLDMLLVSTVKSCPFTPIRNLVIAPDHVCFSDSSVREKKILLMYM